MPTYTSRDAYNKRLETVASKVLDSIPCDVYFEFVRATGTSPVIHNYELPRRYTFCAGICPDL